MNATLQINGYDEDADTFDCVQTDVMGNRLKMTLVASLLPYLVPTEECPHSMVGKTYGLEMRG